MHARTGDEITRALVLARERGLPVTVLGGGSNVLVADTGLRGLVIRVHGGEVARIDAGRIRADAGVTINGLVRWTINHGVAGLEAWAGTPGTVGGRFGNAHFRAGSSASSSTRVTLATLAGDVVDVPAAAMEFGYDYSRLHRTREVVLSADFRVTDGEPAALRAVARESLAFRKRTQPLESASAGCIFQNPDPARDERAGGHSAVGRRAGRSRRSQGRPRGTRPGVADARELHRQRGRRHRRRHPRSDRALQTRGTTRFGVSLREEIVYLGFGDGSGQVDGRSAGSLNGDTQD